MKQANFSPQKMFYQIAETHEPLLSFSGKSASDFEEWKTTARPKIKETLGIFPDRVDPNPELIAEWRHDGLIKQRWRINLHEFLSTTVLINIPENAQEHAPLPAIFCWHGHGPFGKEVVMGNDSSPEMRENIDRHNYAYGHVMAKAGFVTFAIDWLGNGDMAEGGKPNWNVQNGQRDWCNLYYVHATMLGMTSISINVAFGMMATDFVCGLPEVDGARLGVMGLSGGGTMTTWTSFCDKRFRAAEIICYSGYWPVFGFRDINYCGMQVAPGLFRLAHLHDIQGSLAPMPLLVDIGAYDTCFKIDESMHCYRGVEKIYGAAGVADKLHLDLFPGEHGWGGNRSVEFFQAYL